MSLIWFYIIISVAVIGIIAMIAIEFPFRCRVKAGEADKYVFGATVSRKMPEIIVDNCCIKTSKYKHMVVVGDSMKDYGIHSGDSVFVVRFNKNEQNSIVSHPVLAIKLHHPHKLFDSKLKLRKFVGYVDDKDWGAAYSQYQDRIKEDVTKKDFIQSCAKSYSKSKFNIDKNTRVVLSETYEVDNCKYHYSVHSVGSIYGKVLYVGK